jgi:alpha-D-xyloside xylohydrolase
VFDEGNRVRDYLPPGEWTDFFTSERVTGGRYLTETDVSYFRVPLFVREGTLPTVGAHDDRPEYDYTEGLELDLFALGDGATASAVVHAPSGAERARFTVTRTVAQIELRATGGKDLRVRIRQSPSAKATEGGSLVESGPAGALFSWSDPTKPLRIALGEG